MEDPTADQQRYLERVVATLHDDLGPDLIGVYLHGSLAMGAFTPGRSDIDVLAVCANELSTDRSIALGQEIVTIPTAEAGGDLEFSLVSREALGSTEAPAFEVHLNTHGDPQVVDGHDRDGDQDLALHFAIVRERGRSLYGPPPAELFPQPDRAALLEAMRDDVETARRFGAAWWDDHDLPEAASMTYLVLNGARILRYLQTGELGSKLEGAAWLEGADPDPDVHTLLAAALTYQRGGAPELPDARVVDAFMDRVELALRGADA